MTRYAKVVVPSPLRTEFTYSFDTDRFDLCCGMRVTVPFGRSNRKTRAYVVEVSDTAPDNGFEVKEVSGCTDKEPVFSYDNYKLALWMERFYFSSRGIVMDTMIPGGKRDTEFGGLEASALGAIDHVVQLTDEQENAVRAVSDADGGLFYVYGVTGSGKTEVFLRCAEETIRQGRQVIYLVPEITLTNQLVKQVSARFRDNVAILHSGLTDSQRIKQWRRIKKGEVGLVIGVRSAVFAPCDRLGLIIIDEEHENTYKSGNDPRYHARQVAQKRVADCGAKLLMGSATPSLEAWNLMKDPSRMVRLDLTKRVGGGSMPQIVVADMNREKGIFSRTLQLEMSRTLSEGKQVILFLNRRGYSYSLHCRSCGHEVKCPHCDVALTYHKKKHEMVCHYCGHREKPIAKCPECGSMDIGYSGFGTEQVEQELAMLFPQYTSARLDTDVVSADRKVIDRTLDDFREGKIKILLGTQMVAKGLDFPNVSLVGIIMADSTLTVPDFRAQERTFDLIVQVSGRSGRADGNGKVVIQTRMKDNPAITNAVAGTTSGFFETELSERRETGFPPFSRMVNLVCRSKDQQKASDFADRLADELRARNVGTGENSFDVFGAQECAIEKINTNWRYQVLLRSMHPTSMLSALSDVLSCMKVPSSVYLEIDVDPVDML